MTREVTIPLQLPLKHSRDFTWWVGLKADSFIALVFDKITKNDYIWEFLMNKNIFVALKNNLRNNTNNAFRELINQREFTPNAISKCI